MLHRLSKGVHIGGGKLRQRLVAHPCQEQTKVTTRTRARFQIDGYTFAKGGGRNGRRSMLHLVFHPGKPMRKIIAEPRGFQARGIAAQATEGAHDVVGTHGSAQHQGHPVADIEPAGPTQK
jgi:hypothetical protein